MQYPAASPGSTDIRTVARAASGLPITITETANIPKTAGRAALSPFRAASAAMGIPHTNIPNPERNGT